MARSTVPAPPDTPVVLTVGATFEKDTKNFHAYKVDVVEGSFPAVSGSLYIRLGAYGKTAPSRISITIAIDVEES